MATPPQPGTPLHPKNPAHPAEAGHPVDAIHWPPRYLPESAPVVVRNELLIPAPLPIVWNWLLRAGSWPDWYPNAHDVHFLSHTGPDLRDRSRFRWKTFGLRVTSKVLEFVPPTAAATPARLAWDAHGIGIDAWHAWLLTPRPDGHTHVLTAEVQHGWLARLGKLVTPTRIGAQHQIWLEGLSRQAQNGALGAPGALAAGLPTQARTA